MTAKFQVQQLGAGFIPIGKWYWCRLDANGFPDEPINSHGPFFSRCLAVSDGQKALGPDAQAVNG